jgi:hypothetical protein
LYSSVSPQMLAEKRIRAAAGINSYRWIWELVHREMYRQEFAYDNAILLYVLLIVSLYMLAVTIGIAISHAWLLSRGNHRIRFIDQRWYPPSLLILWLVLSWVPIAVVPIPIGRYDTLISLGLLLIFVSSLLRIIELRNRTDTDLVTHGSSLSAVLSALTNSKRFWVYIMVYCVAALAVVIITALAQEPLSGFLNYNFRFELGFRRELSTLSYYWALGAPSIAFMVFFRNSTRGLHLETVQIFFRRYLVLFAFLAALASVFLAIESLGTVELT